MKILVFDNYDSFTFNLVHLVKQLTTDEVTVVRNDQILLEEISAFDKIILSPGPGIPEEAGLLLPLIKAYASEKSIFGVCLGHQAIGEAFGATLLNLPSVFHGVATPIELLPVVERGNDWFSGLQFPLEVGRYHSWVVSDEQLPACIEVTARDANQYIMSLRHREWDVQGVQFHPESILTPHGLAMMQNWLTK
ncbi:MAG: aminodeoxychorismate/anthranilate synthase component II [Chitinophagia bacterium]|nr:aminodeoxychorismate/anthranilate synthase component II [Chitinophagia bacterium]